MTLADFLESTRLTLLWVGPGFSYEAYSHAVLLHSGVMRERSLTHLPSFGEEAVHDSTLGLRYTSVYWGENIPLPPKLEREIFLNDAEKGGSAGATVLASSTRTIAPPAYHLRPQKGLPSGVKLT